MDERELRNRVKNKMIRPTTIPQTLEALVFEQAVAREALRLAYQQHKEFATTLKGVQQQRTVGDVFSQQTGGQSDRRQHAARPARRLGRRAEPRAAHAARRRCMLIDAFEPEGFTSLAKDSIFMMPHLGVLAGVHAQAAMEVFERDCLIVLGTCVAAKGEGKAGKPCFRYSISGGGLSEKGQIAVGDLLRFSLAPAQTANVEVQPERGFDCGAGPGKAISREVKGGTVGLVLDARGRPLALPEETSQRRASLRRWFEAMDLYPA